MKGLSLSLLALLVFLASCGLKEPEFRRIGNIHVARIGLQEAVLNADLHYFNPNKSRLRLREATGEAWLDGVSLGRFTLDSLIDIPSKDSFLLPVTLKMDMSKLLKNTATFLLKKEAVIKVDGVAWVGKGGIFIKYPIRYEGKQDLSQVLFK